MYLFRFVYVKDVVTNIIFKAVKIVTNNILVLYLIIYIHTCYIYIYIYMRINYPREKKLKEPSLTLVSRGFTLKGKVLPRLFQTG